MSKKTEGMPDTLCVKEDHLIALTSMVQRFLELHFVATSALPEKIKSQMILGSLTAGVNDWSEAEQLVLESYSKSAARKILEQPADIGSIPAALQALEQKKAKS